MRRRCSAELTATAADCRARSEQKTNSLKRFGYLLDFSPQYDAIYLQWLLALYALRHDRTLYAMAADNARNARSARPRRRRPLPALLERRNARAPERAAGDAADAGRLDQPVRLAGRVLAAGLNRGSPHRGSRPRTPTQVRRARRPSVTPTRVPNGRLAPAPMPWRTTTCLAGPDRGTWTRPSAQCDSLNSRRAPARE